MSVKDPPWRRLSWPGRTIPDGWSTFGAPLSLADDHDLDAILDQALAGARAAGTHHTNDTLTRALELDHQLALTSDRWRENDEGMLFQHESKFVPGDVVAMRSSAVRHLARATSSSPTDHSKNPNRQPSLHRAAHLAHLLYAARPFWLPHSTAWGVMATKPLTDHDRSELLLPCPALVTFSSPMEITPDYIATDLRLAQRLDEAHDLDPQTPPHLETETAGHYPPMQVRSGTVAILRYHNALTATDPGHHEPLFGYQLIGAVLAPRPDGTLSNAVIWLLRRITPANGTTTMQVMQGQGLTITGSTGTFSMVEGRLDRSLLRPIAEALAAVVAWGAWTAPDPFETPVAAGSGFRKLTRKSAFKKAETRGQIAGVHVLAAREPSIRYSTDTTPTGRTIAPHYRAGHWQRYRVGSRNNWTYQRRRKQPVIVNAGAPEDLENQVRIYRLPPPPPPD